MTILAAVIAVSAALLGVLLTAISLPGIWTTLLVLLLIELWRPELFGWPTLGAVLAIAALAEVAEFLASAAGSGAAKGSRRGMALSIPGSVVGMITGQLLIPVPILGALVGGIIGAGIGAIAGERYWAKRGWGDAARSGLGASAGRALATVVKTPFAIAAAVVVLLGAIF